MNAANRMQKIRLEIQSITESVERNLNKGMGCAKEDTTGSIEHEVKTVRRDLMYLVSELKNPVTRKREDSKK